MQAIHTVPIRTITISGAEFELIPYTESRRKRLEEINKDIQVYVEENAERAWDDLPRKDKARFWERKFDVLLKPIGAPPKSDFFESDDFEYTRLHDVESFFLLTRNRL
jgi:hypothetical protein